MVNQGGNSGRPPASHKLSSSPDFSDQSMNTHGDDTAHDSDSKHSLNSENHDGRIILVFVDSRGFLMEKPCGELSHSCRGDFPQGRLAQSTAPFQAPSSPCGSFTYCSVAGAEGVPGNLFKLSLQTALCIGIL